MVYQINNKRVSKEIFEMELQKRIDEYIPYSEYYPKKEDVRKVLRQSREFMFNVYDKRYKDKLVIVNRVKFTAVEEEILEIVRIIEANQYDPLDNDALTIAIALYNSGYRLTHQHENKGENK